MKAAAKPEPPMKGQLTIFDIMAAEDAKETAPDSARPEPETGAWVYDHGPVIPHIMRPGFIGRKVVYTCGTQSKPNLCRVGILERYFYNEHAECWRSVIDYGAKGHRTLIDHRNGREIYEVEDVDLVERARMARRIQIFPPVAELTLEQAAQIIERQTGLGFYTNRFGQKEANAGHGLKITVEKSRYDLDDDKRPFLGGGWSKGTSGGGAPLDTVEEAIYWIRSVMDKWRDK